MDPILIGEILAVLMFVGVIGTLLIGFPVAFSLAGISPMPCALMRCYPLQYTNGSHRLPVVRVDWSPTPAISRSLQNTSGLRGVTRISSGPRQVDTWAPDCLRRSASRSRIVPVPPFAQLATADCRHSWLR